MIKQQVPFLSIKLILTLWQKGITKNKIEVFVLKIESIGKSKVKIILTKYDLEEYDLDYETLSCENSETRVLIRHLADLANSEFGFKRRGRQLVVRTLPLGAGGCVMYFSLIPHSGKSRIKRDNGPFVYEFEDAETLLRAIETLHLHGHSKEVDSKLYFTGDTYKLVLITSHAPPQYMEHILTEFGHRCTSGVNALAFANEHYQLILEHDAIATVGEKISSNFYPNPISLTKND